MSGPLVSNPGTINDGLVAGCYFVCTVKEYSYLEYPMTFLFFTIRLIHITDWGPTFLSIADIDYGMVFNVNLYF